MTSGFAAAFAFLTRVPVGRLTGHDRDALAAAAPFYPVIGAALGALAGALAHGLHAFLPPMLAAALVVACIAAVTGAMHLDALADSADALGGWSREERLRIMRDHAIGAFGATALGLALVIEVAALATLVERSAAVVVFVAVGASSRGAALPLAALLPYARVEERGATVADGISRRRAAGALALAGALSVPAGLVGIVVFAVALALAAACGLFYRRWLGGVTGDAMGAVVQLAEVAGLVVAVALP